MGETGRGGREEWGRGGWEVASSSPLGGEEEGRGEAGRSEGGRWWLIPRGRAGEEDAVEVGGAVCLINARWGFACQGDIASSNVRSPVADWGTCE